MTGGNLVDIFPIYISNAVKKIKRQLIRYYTFLLTL